MLYMLSKNHHRLGNLNFNQIKQVCLNDKCKHKIENPIVVNDIVLENIELSHSNCEEDHKLVVHSMDDCQKIDDVNEQITVSSEIETPLIVNDIVLETVELSHSNCEEDQKFVVHNMDDCQKIDDISEQISVSSEIKKMEEVIKHQKVVRKIYRKNSW